MAGPTRNLTIAIIIVAAVVAFVPGLLALSNCLGLSGSHSDWFVQVEADPLVQFTDRIVVARYAEKTRYAPKSPASPAESSVTFVDVYRGFEVVESLKGDFEAGDTAYVKWFDGHFRRNENGDPQFIGHSEVPLTPGETYVLFLNRNRGRRPPDLDITMGIWRPSNGLVAARIDANGRLSFQTTRHHRAALKDMSLKPVPGSGAPFELTIDDIRTQVSAEDPAVNQ